MFDVRNIIFSVFQDGTDCPLEFNDFIMPDSMGNDNLFAFLTVSGWSGARDNTFSVNFKMALAAIFNVTLRISPNLYNTHFIGFFMSELVGIDTSFASLAFLMPEIYQFLFFIMALAAMLYFTVRMTPNLYKTHFIEFSMSELVGNDTLFVSLACRVPEITRFL